jgi:hypothetical protein
MSVFFDISSPRIYGVSYCIESRFQLSVLRLLDEDMLVVNVLYDVDVAILGVNLHDDGFDRGIAMYEYALRSCQHILDPVVSWRSYPVEREA